MLTIRSNIEKELLTYYFLNAGAAHHINELARILNLDPANLDKKLKQLEAFGLFTSERRGNQAIYSLNRKFPLFKEYSSIINKTYGLENLLKKHLKNVKGIENAYIFGSYANTVFDNFSDIDLLVVGKQNAMDLSNALHKTEKMINREINPIEFGPAEYSKQIKKNPLLIDIFKKKTIKII